MQSTKTWELFEADKLALHLAQHCERRQYALAERWVVNISLFPEGEQALRQIVKEDLLGMGKVVKDAIW